MELSLKFPGENLLIKLWETLTEKGIGSLLKPWQIRREGTANIDMRVREHLALAQAEKHASDILAGSMTFSNGRLTLSSSVPNEKEQTANHTNQHQLEINALIQVATKNTLADSIRREINISKALLHAEEALEQDSREPSDKKIDDDWLFRWRDYAGSVSSEQLQSIWGKVLSGELKAPGSFSLRTLDFLHNISQTEAESITKLLRFAIGNVIFNGSPETLAREGINLDFLLEMENLGIVSGIAPPLRMPYSSNDLDKYTSVFTSNGKVLIATHNDPTQKIYLQPVIKITRLGQQIIRLGKFEPHDEYLRIVGNFIKQQGFEVEFAEYVEVNEDIINSFNSKKL